MNAHQTHEIRSWLSEKARSFRHIAVLTGAGISAESGIPTFRGSDGLWRQRDPSALFTPEALATDPVLVWQMYDELRARIAGAQPNAGHVALARLDKQRAVTLATQNIDGLHQRAGSEGVVELHGTLWRLRCEACAHAEYNHAVPLPDIPPRCPGCAAILRPDIVLFTEPLPQDALMRAWQAAGACDLMLVIGTSGVVYPAAALPGIAKAAGAAVLEINPQQTALTPHADHSLRATAAEALPWVVDLLVNA